MTIDGELGAALRAAALALPEAHEAHPWGETVVKVGTRIFAFLGRDIGAGLGVKLPHSAHFALQHAWATPTGYGLGKHGWVSLDLTGDNRPDTELLLEWIEESYRAVATRRLVAQVEQRR